MKYVYKIFSALCAIAILPLLVFSPLVYYHISSVALQGILTLAQLMGSEALQNAMNKNDLTEIPAGIADTFSLYEIGDLVERFGDGFSSGAGEELAFLLPGLISVVVSFVFIAVCAILTAIFAFACKDNRKVIASSFAGIGFSIMFVTVFNDFASPFLSGKINLSNFIDSFLASLIAEVEEFSVASTFYFVPILFAVIALWTVLYNATLPEKEKAQRQKMIG